MGGKRVQDLESASDFYQQARKMVDAERFEDAIELFQESARLSPHFKTLELLGECLLKLGRIQESIIPLAAATTLNRGVRAAALLAEAFLLMGEKDKAIETANEALRRDPTNRKAGQIINSLSEYIERTR